MLNGQPVPSEYIVDGDNVRFVDNGNLINGASFDGHISEPLIGLNYTNLYKLYYNNYLENNGMEFEDRSKNELVYVSAVPVLTVDNVKVYYEQFRTNLEINLATISNASEIEAANITFKHTIDEDSATVTFNIQGPFINNSNIKLYCDIYKLNASTVDLATTFEVQDINFFGQNTIDIPFDSGFVKEDIYILTFRFEQNSTTLKHVNKIFIASQALNKYYDTVSEYNGSISLSE